MRVLAAMSGGVDSAVAAALAVDAGHDVTGVHMALSRNPGTLRTGSRGCCTVEDAFDARRVCDLLGIPYYVWDFSEDFLEDVVADFLSEYSAGRRRSCWNMESAIRSLITSLSGADAASFSDTVLLPNFCWTPALL